MKRKVILISMMLLLSAVIYSQESLKKSLEVISTDLCSKMAEKGKRKVVVLFVTDINKAQTTAGKYMADVVSFYIVNNPSGFSVFDRENLSGIAEAKKLIAEGYIDANNVKELGKILSVEAIVVGNYTVLSSSLSLTLKTLDVNDGFVIAQSLNDLPIDKDAAMLLGISPLDGSQNSLSNKGFDNRPLNSNECYNNPETVSKDCLTQNTGDYCFTNNTGFTIKITLDYSEILTIEPNQSQCFYNIPVKNHVYDISDPGIIVHKGFDIKHKTGPSKIRRHGQINVEKCKSKTFVIK